MALGQTISRDNRRRRVLQDETRRSSSFAPTPVTEGARYTDAANVENHPQITQFIPRRYRSYAFGLTLAAGAIAAIELSHMWADDFASAIASGPVVAVDLASGGGLAAWFSALVLASIAVVAYVVYSLRKHRVDDYKARYRLWLWICGAALLASADSVARLHQVWSSLWASQTGWAVEGATWWLVPAGVFGVWVALRLVLETAECRGACSFVVVSTLAYSAALSAAVGVLPGVSGSVELVVVSSTLLVGHVVALAAVTLYARYVVLDVQGLIPRDVAKHAKSARARLKEGEARAKDATDAAQDAATPATLPLSSPTAERRRKQPRKSQPTENQDPAWVDGSGPEDDAYQDEGGRAPGKLSKADRKRLRMQRRQAA